jgi:hypothetical protein
MVGQNFGPIPYVVGSHTLKVTAVCKGGDRRLYRIDHPVRVTLRELRRRDAAVLHVGIEFDGSLDKVEISPEDAGSIG